MVPMLFLFFLIAPHVFSLKVLSFERLKYEKKPNISMFVLKDPIEQVCQNSYGVVSGNVNQLDSFKVITIMNISAP